METAAKRAEDYRQRAAELRELAARELEGSMIKDQLTRIAAQYELLAKQAERN